MKPGVIDKGETVRMPENPKERQEFRKKKQNSSRFLDNYFNPHLYDKSWWPNGCYILKKKYNYSEIGLSYNYEKNNTLQKMTVDEKNQKKKLIKDFLEYDFIEENEYIVTIEYCSNCEEHQTHTQHSSELYKNFATYTQKSIMTRYPFIKVLLKPVDTDIKMEANMSNTILSKTKIIDNKYKEVRIGALEVQLCFRRKNEKDNQVISLHSKLNSGVWPSISNLLNQIVAYVPFFNAEVKLFDRESFEEDSKDEKDVEGLLNTKLQGIKVNVYKLKCKPIEEMCLAAKEELDNMNDPKKRKSMMLTQRMAEKESYSKTKSSQNNTFLPSILGDTRPISSISKIFFDRTNQKNSSSGFYRPVSTYSNMHTKSIQMMKEENEISDKETIASYKDELIRTMYSNEQGVVFLENLPHDSYLIEVEESSNFQTTASILRFKHIHVDKPLPKFIGLNKQQNTFLQVFLYITKKKNEETVEELISDADVILQLNSASNEDKLIFEEQETKIKLKESTGVKGRYEEVIPPGKYIIEVRKRGFDIVRKSVKLQSGENKINIELFNERNYKLKVSVSNYEKFSSIENAFIKVRVGNSDIVYDGVTNVEGFCEFDTPGKEDFVTIFVEKPGFFNAQRTYVRDITNESEDNTREIVVLLVKESFIGKDNCILMVTYSNNFDENFEPVYLYSENIGTYTDISCADSQSENGILTSYFKYHPPQSDEKEQLNHKDDEELEEIVRLMLRIKPNKLKKSFKLNQSAHLNGLQRFSCECCIYTPNNVFYIASPSFSREQDYEFWDICFLDVKNVLVYEISLLSKNIFEKNLFFYDWTNFLQLAIDKKLYLKLFELLDFDKGQYIHNDRFLYEPTFIRSLRKITQDIFSADFLLFICDIMKSNNKMVAYSILKKKLSSNLKNFRDNLKITFSNTMGQNYVK